MRLRLFADFAFVRIAAAALGSSVSLSKPKKDPFGCTAKQLQVSPRLNVQMTQVITFCAPQAARFPAAMTRWTNMACPSVFASIRTKLSTVRAGLTRKDRS
jgi:hypothetical protein